MDEALDLIESAAATGIIPPSALQEDLWFEALREEPRFVAAVETCRRNREAR